MAPAEPGPLASEVFVWLPFIAVPVDRGDTEGDLMTPLTDGAEPAGIPEVDVIVGVVTLIDGVLGIVTGIDGVVGIATGIDGVVGIATGIDGVVTGTEVDGTDADMPDSPAPQA